MQDDSPGRQILGGPRDRGPQAGRHHGRLLCGYATLAGVAFTPDVYAGAVSIVGPSNLITLLDSIPPYWEPSASCSTSAWATRERPRQSPTREAVAAQLGAKIKTPLMVVQGANDPRVNKAESDQIVIALRRPRLPGRIPGGARRGPRFARPVNNMAMFAAAEKFMPSSWAAAIRRWHLKKWSRV